MGQMRNLFVDCSGATSIEYAFLVAMIALALIGSLNLAGTAVGSTMTTAANRLDTAPAFQNKI